MMDELEELNLTEEEIAELKSEGLLPPEYGQPPETLEEEFDPGTAEAGGPLPDPALPDERGEEIRGGALDSLVAEGAAPQKPDPAAEIQQGKALLGTYEIEAPTTPGGSMAQKFHELAVNWMPTGDKDLAAARQKAQEAADQLAQLRAEADARASRFPMGDFGAALLEGGWGNPIQRFSKAYQVANKAREVNRANAQKLGVGEAAFKGRRADTEEAGIYHRVNAAANMERSAALLKQAEAKILKVNPSALGKRAADLGIDINTPEGQLSMRRMYVMEQAKSDPATLRTLMENPGIDPFTPQFAELVASQHLKLMESKEAIAGTKEKRAEAKEERAEHREDRMAKSAEIQAKETELQTKLLEKKLIDAEKKGEGRPLPGWAAKEIFETQENLRRAERASSLLAGETVGGMKGDPNATGLKGYTPDFILQRTDPSGNPTRAAIADLGSLIIHQRSGAAVTASEYPRLAPFIPKASDAPEVARQKVKRFLQEYKLHLLEMIEFHQEGGYKVPVGALKGIGDIPGGTGKSSGQWKVHR